MVWVSSSVSVSEPLASSSQLSATGFDFGFEAGFWGAVVESLRLPRVSAISGGCQYEGGVRGGIWELHTFFTRCLVHSCHYSVLMLCSAVYRVRLGIGFAG